jgi:nitroreductase
MDTLEAIRTRRSVRSYTGGKIPRADLETIVDAARLAPSGNNKQPWDFIVVTDEGMINQLKIASQWSWIPLPAGGWRTPRLPWRTCY